MANWDFLDGTDARDDEEAQSADSSVFGFDTMDKNRLKKIGKDFDSDKENVRVYRPMTADDIADGTKRSQRFAELGIDDKFAEDYYNREAESLKAFGATPGHAFKKDVFNTMVADIRRGEIEHLAETPGLYDADGNKKDRAGFFEAVRLRRQAATGKRYEPDFKGTLKAIAGTLLGNVSGWDSASAEEEKNLSDFATGKHVSVRELVPAPMGAPGGAAFIVKSVDPELLSDKELGAFASARGLGDVFKGLDASLPTEEKLAALRDAAGKKIFDSQKAKHEAGTILEKGGVSAVRGNLGEGAETVGYTLSYVNPALIFNSTLMDAQRRAAELGTATFGKDGGVTAAADSDRMAAEKGAAGALAETASELIVGAAVDATIGKIPGMKGVGKTASRKLAQSLTGRVALRTGRKLASIGEMAHVNGLPSEVFEEVTTGLANAVGNLETKESETKTTVGGRVKDVFTRLPETAEEVTWGMAALALVGLPVSVKAETAKWQDGERRRDYLRGLGMGAADVEALSGGDAAALTSAVAGDLAKRAKRLALTDEQEIALLASAGMDRDVVAAMTPEERRNHAFALADSEEMREVARAFDKTGRDLQVEARRLNDLRTWNAGAETRKEKFGGDIKGGLATGQTVVDGDVTVKRDASGNGIDVVDRVTGDTVNVPLMDDGNGGVMPETLSFVQQAADRAVRVRAAASESSGNRARIISELASRIFTGGERVVAVENVAEAQAFVDSDRARYGDTPISEKASGATLKDGTVLLVKDNVSSTRDLMQTMLHERLHAAVTAAGITEGEYAGKLAELSGIDPAYLKKRAARIRAQYARQGVSITELGAAEEALASESETGRELFRSTLWQVLWQGVRGDKAGMAKARADVYGLVGGMGGKGVTVDHWASGMPDESHTKTRRHEETQPTEHTENTEQESETPEAPTSSDSPAPAGFRPATPEQGARLKELGIPHVGVSFEEADELLSAAESVPASEASGVNAGSSTGSAREPAPVPEVVTPPVARTERTEVDPPPAPAAVEQKTETPESPSAEDVRDAETDVEYGRRFGSVLNTDNAKELQEGYDRADAKSVVAHHPEAGRTVRRLFDKWLVEKKGAGDGTVVFAGGGAGAGKSTAVEGFKKHADFVFDSTMASGDALRDSVRKVIDNGQTPVLTYVYRDPVDAWINGVKGRVAKGGHIVPATAFARSHVNSRKNFLSLADEFGDKVEAKIYENVEGTGLKRISAAELREKPAWTVEALKLEVERAERNAEKELERVGEPGRRGGEEGGGTESVGKNGAGEKGGAEARASAEVTPSAAASSSTPVPPKPVRGADEGAGAFKKRWDAWKAAGAGSKEEGGSSKEKPDVNAGAATGLEKRPGEDTVSYMRRVAAQQRAAEESHTKTRRHEEKPTDNTENTEVIQHTETPSAPSLTLDGGTDADIDADAAKLAAQKKKAADREEVLHRAAAPIKGNMGDTTAVFPGMEETDDIPLFSQKQQETQPADNAHTRDAAAFAAESRLVLSAHNNDRVDSCVAIRFVSGLPLKQDASRKEREEHAEAEETRMAAADSAGRKFSSFGLQGPTSGWLTDIVNRHAAQKARSTRTPDSVERQAYSTPMPLAAFIGEAVRRMTDRLPHRSGRTLVVEPTAGNGALLAVHAGVAGAHLFANEIDTARVERMRELFGENHGDNTFTTHDMLSREGTEAFYAEIKKAAGHPLSPNLVFLANPPFGKAREGGYMPGKFRQHVELGIVKEGLQRMMDAQGANPELRPVVGAFVIASPQGLRANKGAGGVNAAAGTESPNPSDVAKHYRSGEYKPFFQWLGERFFIEKFTLRGDMYGKNGAQFPVDVVFVRQRVTPAELDSANVDLTWHNNPQVVQDYGQLVGRLYPNTAAKVGESASDVRFRLAGEVERGERAPETGLKVYDLPADHLTLAADWLEFALESGVFSGDRQLADDAVGLYFGEKAEDRETGETLIMISEEIGRMVSGDGKPWESYTLRDGIRSLYQDKFRERWEKEHPPEPPDNTSRGRDTIPLAGAIQTDYSTGSAPESVLGAKISTMLAESANHALAQLEADVGDVVDFVSDEMGWTREMTLGALDSSQAISVAMMIRNFKEGRGFILGDQTGFGKGRQLAAYAWWNVRNGRLPVFVTGSSRAFDELSGAMREIGVWDEVRPFVTNSDFDTFDASGATGTPRDAIGIGNRSQHLKNGRVPDGANMVVTTYSQFQQSNMSAEDRKEFLRRAVAGGGALILDESHLAAGEESERGAFFRSLVKLGAERGAPAMFSSATFAKRPDTMAIYTMGTSVGKLFNGDDAALTAAFARFGVPFQEWVSSFLAANGEYIRRESSFEGITFNEMLTTQGMDADAKADAEEREREASDAFGAFVRQMLEIQSRQKSLGGMVKRAHGKDAPRVQFTEWSSVIHNFLGFISTAVKSRRAADLAVEALWRGESPVVTLYNTMESRLREIGEGNRATPRVMLEEMARKTVNVEFDGQTVNLTDLTSRQRAKMLRYMTEDQLDPLVREAKRMMDITAHTAGRLEALDIPASPIDYVAGRIRDAGFGVLEVTGRELEASPSGIVRKHVKENGREVINRFNSEAGYASIINVSAAASVSMHASGRFGNRQKRVMIVLQAMPDINDTIQVLGRVNRSGQVEKPEYYMLTSTLLSERRQSSILMKKLRSLSANSSGEADGNYSVEGYTDVFNEYGEKALEEILSEPSKYPDAATVANSVMSNVGGLGVYTKYLAFFPHVVQETVWGKLNELTLARMEIASALGENTTQSMDIGKAAGIRYLPPSERGFGVGRVMMVSAARKLNYAQSEAEAKDGAAAWKGPVIVKLRAAFADERAKRIGAVKSDDAKTRMEDNIRRQEREITGAIEDIGATLTDPVDGHMVMVLGVARVGKEGYAATPSNYTVTVSHNNRLGVARMSLPAWCSLYGKGIEVYVSEPEFFDVRASYEEERQIVYGDVSRYLHGLYDGNGGFGMRPGFVRYVPDGSDAPYIGALIPRGIEVSHADVERMERVARTDRTAKDLDALPDDGTIPTVDNRMASKDDTVIIGRNQGGSYTIRVKAGRSVGRATYAARVAAVGEAHSETVGGHSEVEARGGWYVVRGAERATTEAFMRRLADAGMVFEVSERLAELRADGVNAGTGTGLPNVRFRLALTPEAREQMHVVAGTHTAMDGNRLASWMKAPNGQPTRLNDEQWLLVRTPNFKAWFGDWEGDPANASKVLDENGEPLVVYHGGNIGVSVFKTPDVGVWFSSGTFIPKFMLELRDAYVEKMPPGELYSVFLSIKNPRVFKTTQGMDAYDALSEETERVTGENYSDEDYKNHLIEQGYDGIKLENTRADYGALDTQFVAFFPSQIKSATDNTGAFSRDNPDVRFRLGEAVQQAESETDINPTDEQKAAGNYRKGRFDLWGGVKMAVENPVGSVRRGVDASGRPWQTTMQNTYGYFAGETDGKDGDKIDFFLGDDLLSETVFVVDQVDPRTGEFDEHKVMVGFSTPEDAESAYLSNYEEGWGGLGEITAVPVDVFKEWMRSSDRKLKLFAEYAMVTRGVNATAGTGSGVRFRLTDEEAGLYPTLNYVAEMGGKLLTPGVAARRAAAKGRSASEYDDVRDVKFSPEEYRTFFSPSGDTPDRIATGQMNEQGIGDGYVSEFWNRFLAELNLRRGARERKRERQTGYKAVVSDVMRNTGAKRVDAEHAVESAADWLTIHDESYGDAGWMAADALDVVDMTDVARVAQEFIAAAKATDVVADAWARERSNIPLEDGAGSVRKAATEAARDSLGLPPVRKDAPFTDAKAVEDAAAATADFAEVQAEGRRVVADLLAKPRAPTKTETATLLAYEMWLSNAFERHDKEAMQYAQWGDTGSLDLLDAEREQWRRDVDRLTEAARLAGREAGRSLQSFKMMMDRDYNLVRIMRDARKRNDEPLSREQLEKLARIAQRLKKAVKAFREATAGTAERELEDAHEEIMRMVEEGERLAADQAAVRQRVSEAEARIGELGEERERLLKEIDEAEKAFAALEAELAGDTETLAAKRAEMERAIDAARARVAELHVETDAMRAEIAALNEQKRKAEARARAAEERLRKNHARAKELREKARKMDAFPERVFSPQKLAELQALTEEMKAAQDEKNQALEALTWKRANVGVKMWYAIRFWQNLRRAMQTSGDTSVAGRQNGRLLLSNPLLWLHAFVDTFGLIAPFAGGTPTQGTLRSKSDLRLFLLESRMRADPLFDEARRAGLDWLMTDSQIGDMDEFRGNVSSTLRGFGRAGQVMASFIDISQNHYAGFSNHLHLAVYRQLRGQAVRALGRELTEGEKQAIAVSVNVLGGRGDLRDPKCRKLVAASADIFYSPRMMLANVQTISRLVTIAAPHNDVVSWKVKAIQYSMYARMAAGFVVAGLAKRLLDAAFGDGDDDDEKLTRALTHAQFGKLIVGATPLDVTGGLAMYIRTVARLGGSSSAKRDFESGVVTGNYKGQQSDLLFGFAQSKLSPFFASMTSLILGKDYDRRAYGPNAEPDAKGYGGRWGNFLADQIDLMPLGARDVYAAATGGHEPLRDALTFAGIMEDAQGLEEPPAELLGLLGVAVASSVGVLGTRVKIDKTGMLMDAKGLGKEYVKHRDSFGKKIEELRKMPIPEDERRDAIERLEAARTAFDGMIQEKFGGSEK